MPHVAQPAEKGLDDLHVKRASRNRLEPPDRVLEGVAGVWGFRLGALVIRGSQKRGCCILCEIDIATLGHYGTNSSDFFLILGIHPYKFGLRL